ncbi:unnamed protein product [Rhizoctonia solani]|uniref:Uncharacterized protein n=1 Tax=Rhizoctonia solani TaxID=456999 RepID=A0A8H2X308_9AGAM|nr:unnamed protein product [Rhizoctonia solani]
MLREEWIQAANGHRSTLHSPSYLHSYSCNTSFAMKLELSIIALITLPMAVLAVPTSNVGRDGTKVTDGTFGSFCGGIAGFKCNKGLLCKLDGNYPDAGGVCIRDPVFPDGALGSTCGGIVGFKCNSGLVCLLDGNYPDAAGVCVLGTEVN